MLADSLVKLVHARNKVESIFTKYPGITEFIILEKIANAEGTIVVWELANFLQVSRSAISQILAKLKHKNLVMVQDDFLDKRRTRLYISLAGRKRMKLLGNSLNKIALTEDVRQLLCLNLTK